MASDIDIESVKEIYLGQVSVSNIIKAGLLANLWECWKWNSITLKLCSSDLVLTYAN